MNTRLFVVVISFFVIISLAACFSSITAMRTVPVSQENVQAKAAPQSTESLSSSSVAISTSVILSAQHNITSVDSPMEEKPMVALSFDDGPGNDSTKRILDLIEKYNISATFFVVGDQLDGRGEILKRELQLGCEIGNHTFSHNIDLATATDAQIQAEIQKTDDLLFSLTGTVTQLIRPPYGSYDLNRLESAKRPYVLWSVDTEDWKSQNKDEIFEVIKSSVFDGAIILMHDIYPTTADACELVIPWLLNNGYDIVNVSALLKARGVTPLPGQAYRMACKDGKTR